jgi:hypothetical protein
MANDAYRHTLVKMPFNRRLPHVGVAEHWRSEWIGGLIFDCSFGGDAFHYQECENGIIAGVFRKDDPKASRNKSL